MPRLPVRTGDRKQAVVRETTPGGQSRQRRRARPPKSGVPRDPEGRDEHPQAPFLLRRFYSSFDPALGLDLMKEREERQGRSGSLTRKRCSSEVCSLISGPAVCLFKADSAGCASRDVPASGALWRLLGEGSAAPFQLGREWRVCLNVTAGFPASESVA